MANKRNGLVPIGKAFGGLGGPVQAIRADGNLGLYDRDGFIRVAREHPWPPSTPVNALGRCR